jgi:hypothetical protein
VSRAKNLLLYASLCEQGHLYFFAALVLLELLPAKEMSRIYYSNEASNNRWPGTVMLLPQQHAKKITGAREVRLKFKKKKNHFIHDYFYVCFKLIL